MSDESNRRRHARTDLSRPAKVQCELTGRFYSASTCNISAGGALLEVVSPSLLVSGQAVRIAVAWGSAAALTPRRDMLRGVVQRALAAGGRQYVAIAFAPSQFEQTPLRAAG